MCLPSPTSLVRLAYPRNHCGAPMSSANKTRPNHAYLRIRRSELRGRASEQGREVERGDEPLAGEGKVLTGDGVLAVAEDGAQQTDRLGEIAWSCLGDCTSPHRVF